MGVMRMVMIVDYNCGVQCSNRYACVECGVLGIYTIVLCFVWLERCRDGSHSILQRHCDVDCSSFCRFQGQCVFVC